MNLCSNKHGELAYEDWNCPACEIRDELQGQLADAKKEIAELEAKVSQLEDQ